MAVQTAHSKQLSMDFSTLIMASNERVSANLPVAVQQDSSIRKALRLALRCKDVFQVHLPGRIEFLVDESLHVVADRYTHPRRIHARAM